MLQRIPRREWKDKSTEWEKIFANHISYKGLLSRLHKEQFKQQKGQSNLKMGKGFEQTFLQQRHKNGQHMKWFSNSLAGKCKWESQWDLTSYLLR